MSNAIKFTKLGGEVVIHNQEKNCRSHLIIQDEGKGMDKETLDNLFTQDLKSTFGNQGEKKTA